MYSHVRQSVTFISLLVHMISIVVGFWGPTRRSLALLRRAPTGFSSSTKLFWTGVSVALFDPVPAASEPTGAM